jgi:hypothetical protein
MSIPRMCRRTIRVRLDNPPRALKRAGVGAVDPEQMRVLVLSLALLALAASPAAAHELPRGDHHDTVQELDSVDVVRAVGQARLSAMDVGVAATGLPTTWCGGETTTDTTVDQAFDKTLPQFKVVYAYPSDRTDRFAEWKDALQANVSLIEQFVSSQTGSTRAPRFDMGTSCGPRYLDIQTVALPGTRASYVQNMSAVGSYVMTQVNPSPGGRRNYVIFADAMSSGGANGIGELYEGSTSSERPDFSNVHNSGGLTSVLWSPDAAAPGADPNGWWPEGVLHEMTHNMGGVQWSAPHTSQPAGQRSYQYSHCWDGRDVMCYQDGPSMGHPYSAAVCAAVAGAMPQAYDCGQDDYFNPAPPVGSYLATHWNVYNNVFMADCSTLPAGTCLASGPTDPPTSTTAPSVLGTPATGEQLAASKGVWNPAGVSYLYQWLRNGTGIVGATASTYRLTSADRGAMIGVRVTAINPYGSVSAGSASAGPVAARPPVSVAVPAISGAAASGSLLIATAGAWSPAGTSYTYQWQRDAGAGFADVAGASSTTYRLTVADKDALLRIRVVARNADGTGAAYSDDVGPIDVPTPVNTRLPAILGAAKAGVMLTATNGTWSPPAAGYALQWQRDTGAGFADIAGARASTFRLGTPDRNATIRVRVSAVSGDVVVDAYTAELGPVLPQPPVNAILPRVSGGTLVGATLSGTTGNWSPTGASYAYQWQRDAGAGFADVAGATRSTLKLTTTDKDARLRLQVHATNADGAVKAWSAAVGPIRTPAAAATLSAGASSSLRSPSGAVIASATVSGGGGGGARAAARASTGLTVKVRRSADARGRLKAMACGTTCTPLRTLGRRSLTLEVTAPTGRVRIALTRG